jgi:hypothetical protein
VRCRSPATYAGWPGGRRRGRSPRPSSCRRGFYTIGDGMLEDEVNYADNVAATFDPHVVRGDFHGPTERVVGEVDVAVGIYLELAAWRCGCVGDLL